MICKMCKVDKDIKNFHNLKYGLDDCCSQCRAKEKIAMSKNALIGNARDFIVLDGDIERMMVMESIELDKEPCFADSGKECLILKEKDCYECKFYKTVDQLDSLNKDLLGI